MHICHAADAKFPGFDEPNDRFRRIIAIMFVKHISILCLYGLFATQVTAQRSFSDSLSVSRNRLNQHAMTWLGTWAVANIGSGALLASQTSGETRYFWSMNLYWNIVNAGLAGIGYINARKEIGRQYSLLDNDLEQQRIEKLYLFNMGLDLTYITGGFYLRAKSEAPQSDKAKQQYAGYGSSIILQGGFLLLMDGVLFSLHHAHSRQLQGRLRQWELRAGPGGMGMVMHF